MRHPRLIGNITGKDGITKRRGLPACRRLPDMTSGGEKGASWSAIIVIQANI